MPSNKKLLQAAAGSAGGDNLFVEDVFSTFLYTGNGSSGPTITTGIDMLGEGGLVWNKNRTSAIANLLIDSERGVGKYLSSDSTAAQANITGNSFTNTGYVLGTDMGSISGNGYASWSWRKAAGWFDIVIYTGNGVNGRQLPHSLGSTPSMVICKRTDTGQNWIVQHKSLDLSSNKAMFLNNTDALAVANDYWNSTHASSTAITLSGNSDINGNAATYVAYVFGEDAIFGEDGDEQICKMGSYTGNGATAGVSVNLGFEPQWVLVKPSSTTGPWSLIDNMRGWTADSSGDRWIEANTSGAEYTSAMMDLTSTGFTTRGNYSSTNSNGQTYIYMAIRRPMKVPEAGTEVFQALTYSGTGTFPSGTDPNSGVATRTINSSLGFDVDMSITKWRSGGSGTPSPSSSLMDRFRGIYNELFTYDRIAETQGSNTGPRFSTRASRAFDLHDYGVEQLNKSGQALVSYVFKRAPKFMDMVAYTGNGSVRTINHNLQVAPELMIVKCRSAGSSYWVVYDKTGTATDYLYLGMTVQQGAFAGYWNNTEPTSTVFTLGTGNGNDTNASSQTYIAYLFATLAGVSKVGTYTGTGTGTTVNVDCGFSAGARFVLIKRTDASGDWFVYDSSRGIVSGDSPYLLFNTTAQEVNTDYIDPLSSGFSITPDAAVTGTLNVNNATYIFLAIA